MLSARLIHLIESHEATISARVIRDIRHDPGLAHLAGLPEAEWRHAVRLYAHA